MMCLCVFTWLAKLSNARFIRTPPQKNNTPPHLSSIKRKSQISVPDAQWFEDIRYRVYNQGHQIFIRPTADMFLLCLQLK